MGFLLIFKDTKAGSGRSAWERDGWDDAGRGVASAVHFYLLVAGEMAKGIKMMLLK